MFRAMRFRPPHGWPAVRWELAIVTLGVLIALGAQQAVEAANWRAEVDAGREALREDYRGIVMVARERQADDFCIRNRLTELAALLDDSSGSLPPLGNIGSPPSRAWYPATWDSLVASEVSTHMPRSEMLAYASIATEARLADETVNAELYDWARLYTMVGKGRTIDSGEKAQLRASITIAMYRLNLLRLIASQLQQAVQETKILTQADMKEVSKFVTTMRVRAMCNAIPPPSGRVIEAPYDPAVQRNPLWAHEKAQQN